MSFSRGHHEGRARHRLDDADARLAQPGLHRLGAEYDVQRRRVVIAGGALLRELDASHHALELGIVDRRYLGAVFGRDHALHEHPDRAPSPSRMPSSRALRASDAVMSTSTPEIV